MGGWKEGRQGARGMGKYIEVFRNVEREDGIFEKGK